MLWHFKWQYVIVPFVDDMIRCYMYQIQPWACQIIPDRHWIYITMKMGNIKSVFLLLIVCTSFLLINAGILILVKYKFMSKWQHYLQKYPNIFHSYQNNLSILDEECVDTLGESRCNSVKNKNKCSQNFAQTGCRLTCGVCIPPGNIYIFSGHQIYVGWMKSKAFS